MSYNSMFIANSGRLIPILNYWTSGVHAIYPILTVFSVHVKSSSKVDNRFISCCRHHALNLRLVTLVCRKCHGWYHIHKMFIVVSIRKSNSLGHPWCYATAFFQWLGCGLFQVWPFHKPAWQWNFHSTLFQSKEMERTPWSTQSCCKFSSVPGYSTTIHCGIRLTCPVVCCTLSKGALAPC